MQYNLFTALPNDVGKNGKHCTHCKKYLPLEGFDWHSGANTWRRPECKQCIRELQRIRNAIKKTAPKPDKDHACPICLRTLEDIALRETNRKAAFCIDHDHEKRMFRGWLCHNCNTSLGLLGDNPENIYRAYKYLKDFKDEYC
tara:strand:- start:81 stop:509 length:429 start_codon:yes stop_codon:yes gene_type:complete